jgi:hypothetical protein
MRPDSPADEPGSETDEAPGDLSYDMAHDEATRAERSVGAARPAARSAVAPPPSPEGDYSYDLAHEVPPAQR